MLFRNLGLFLTILSIGLFIPGIMEPMLSLNTEMLAKLGNSSLSASLVDKELSILTTVEELWLAQRFLVASLIFVFSVIIPLIKTSLMGLAYLKRNTLTESKIVGFISSIGKWSMADVFVVAVFLAVLSTNHSETETMRQLTIFSFKMNLAVSSETLSTVGKGFYFFTGYCLLSLLGTQLYQRGLRQAPTMQNHDLTKVEGA